MSRSNIAGGKNQLTKAFLICSQVVITPGLSSFNHTLASPAMDDGKSLSLIASALVVPYQNISSTATEDCLHVNRMRVMTAPGRFVATAQVVSIHSIRYDTFGNGLHVYELVFFSSFLPCTVENAYRVSEIRSSWFLVPRNRSLDPSGSFMELQDKNSTSNADEPPGSSSPHECCSILHLSSPFESRLVVGLYTSVNIHLGSSLGLGNSNDRVLHS
ncbi:hypothetical protein Tco_1036555 [Tanacetum coccineum]